MSVKQLRTLLRTMEALRDVDREMPIQTAVTFLIVATNTDGDISMRDLQARLGVASSSTSRNVAALSKHHRLGKPGYDLVEAYEDLRDRRNKLVRLTAKGRTLALRLSDLIGK